MPPATGDHFSLCLHRSGVLSSAILLNVLFNASCILDLSVSSLTFVSLKLLFSTPFLASRTLPVLIYCLICSSVLSSSLGFPCFQRLCLWKLCHLPSECFFFFFGRRLDSLLSLVTQVCPFLTIVGMWVQTAVSKLVFANGCDEGEERRLRCLRLQLNLASSTLFTKSVGFCCFSTFAHFFYFILFFSFWL